MLTRRRVLPALLLLLVVAVVGGYWYARPLLLTATGYAAHNACAVERLAGRSDPSTDLPDNPVVPVLRTGVDLDTTTGSILGVLAKQRADFTEGFGCTLGKDAPALPAPVEIDPGANPFADLPTPTMSAEVEAAVGEAFGDDLDESARAELGTRAVVAVRGGDLMAERYAEGFDASTPQLGWSMSKSLTNLLAGRLVEQGRLALDDDHLRPEWTDERAEITVDQLLRMTSGLEWNETYDLGTSITRMLYLEPDMGDYVAAQPLAHAPGSYQRYSSGSTTLLCDILLDRTGGDATLPAREVFAPLGMSSAVLEPDASGTPVCSSYLWATPRDWAALGLFALQDGVWADEPIRPASAVDPGFEVASPRDRLLPEGWMAQSTTALDVETEDPGYGSGWWVNTLPDGALAYPELPADAYFAQGHDGQWIVVVPSAELVVVRLGFSPEVDDEGVVALAAALIAVPWA